MADRWVPPPGANAHNYHCSCWQKVGHGHSNACNERLVAQLAETQAQLTQAQAEIARLDKAVRDGRDVNYILAREKDAEIAALREVVEAALPIVENQRRASKMGLGLGLDWATETTLGVEAFDAARAKLKETTGG